MSRNSNQSSNNLQQANNPNPRAILLHGIDRILGNDHNNNAGDENFVIARAHGYNIPLDNRPANGGNQSTVQSPDNFTQHQLDCLEQSFQISMSPGVQQRNELASQLHLDENKIRVWFMKRRAKFRGDGKAKERESEGKLNLK